MLASVLHSEVAINVSIGIMRAFVEMRRFIANNALLFERISNVELKQLEYQKKTDEKLEQIFEYISDHEESNQKIFFDGQIYDAFSLLMAQIFRVERTKNFTVMSNHHFKNKNLTLKAKGLLSLMLSLPDDWNYNMQGLATLSRDGIDSVRSAIKELEHHGYVERHRLRNEYGFYGDTEYIIREVPLGEEND